MPVESRSPNRPRLEADPHTDRHLRVGNGTAPPERIYHRNELDELQAGHRAENLAAGKCVFRWLTGNRLHGNRFD